MKPLRFLGSSSAHMEINSAFCRSSTKPMLASEDRATTTKRKKLKTAKPVVIRTLE